MTQTNYDIQDVARLEASFTNNAGAASDPTTVTCYIKTPDDNIRLVTYSSGAIVKSSTGNYYYDYTISQSGIHTYRFTGTGACIAGSEQNFSVQPSKIITG